MPARTLALALVVIVVGACSSQTPARSNDDGGIVATGGDAGTPSVDAGLPVDDGGQPPSTDAGSPPPPSDDAGSPPPASDAGSPSGDAGSPPPPPPPPPSDGGSPGDGGTPSGAWNIIDLDQAIGPGFRPVALNNVGQVLVHDGYNSFIYDSRAGTLTQIFSSTVFFENYGGTTPVAINDRGTVLFFQREEQQGGAARTFIQRDYQPVFLPSWGGSVGGAALGVQDEVVGIAAVPQNTQQTVYQGFLWRPGDAQLTQVPGSPRAIDADDRILTTVQATAQDGHAALFDSAGLHDLGSLGGASWANGFATHDSFFGVSSDAPGNLALSRPVFWDAAGLHALACPTQNATGAAYGGSGGILVGYCDGAGSYDQRAVLWNGGAPLLLWDVVGRDDVRLWRGIATNAAGQILVIGGHPGGTDVRGFILSPR